MAEPELWEIVKPDFDWDGSLRELHVPGTSTLHWDRVLAGVRSWGWPSQFTIDGVLTSLPESSHESLDLAQRATPLLAIQVGVVRFHCHFFGEGEIEFDIDPREVTDSAAFENVVSFMRQLSTVTERPVFLTPEGGAHLPILSFDPITNHMRYYQPASHEGGAG